MSLTPTNQSQYIFKNPVTILSTGTVTSSTGQTTSLQVEGGAAIAKNTIIGDTLQVGGTSEFNQDSTFKQDITVEGSVTAGITTDNNVIPALFSNNFLVSSFTSPTLTTTATILLDAFSADVYKTAKYTTQIISGSKVHASELLVSHNNTDVFLTEYGIITTANEELGIFDVELISNTITLKFTPATANSTIVKVVRIGITI